MSNAKRKILFQLSGSIACFKACQLLSRLVKEGFDVEVVATKAALNFVGTATLEGLTGKRVHVDTFADGEYMNHIHLERWADVLLLCPATANTINKLAGGVGDDLLSTLFLAHDFKKPYLIAPAMNEKMLQHPATQASLQKLAGWGVTVLPSGRGELACGESGDGRLLEPDELWAHLNTSLNGLTSPGSTVDSKVSRRHVLVTAGGTREPIDQVRALTNLSTGRTGVAIAESFASAGFDVTLLRASDVKFESAAVRSAPFVTYNDLSELLQTELSSKSYDIVIHAAAVGDYALERIGSGASTGGAAHGKIESDDDLVLHLRKTAKLVDRLRTFSKNPKLQVVAFKLTSSAHASERENAVTKLISHAKPDFVVLNDASEVSSSRHVARLYDAHELREVAHTETKLELAEALLRVFSRESAPLVEKGALL